MMILRFILFVKRPSIVDCNGLVVRCNVVLQFRDAMCCNFEMQLFAANLRCNIMKRLSVGAGKHLVVRCYFVLQLYTANLC